MSGGADDDLVQALREALRSWLESACPPTMVRQVEAGASPAALWRGIEAAGFADALRAEARGGAGLSLLQAVDLMEAEATQALPVPLALTAAVRAALDGLGREVPEGSITVALGTLPPSVGGMVRNVPWGRVADWVVLVGPDGAWWLLPTAAAQRQDTGVPGSLRAHLHGLDRSQALHGAAPQPPQDWRGLAAVVLAGLMAGAADRALTLSLRYVQERQQFGRPIGQFQVLQHHLAVMAEQVSAMRMAACVGAASAGSGVFPRTLAAAVAKARTSEAAPAVANAAHALHGAMGITADVDLQLHTRRLHEWRADYGAESSWHPMLGKALLQATDPTTVGFMVDRFFSS